ncbi:hypothetical protein GCM10010909_15980 [Acidocella aquatica]|jgi:hypothetical protein|uniref:Uncharacterized protein n=1 Tax=Acidocella aquatica TaxID=1922313 RepID=A0ABQ6A9K9_9PROT|nr:hypothetical protein [Acidocella aquatica]GLR66918.1 hypothetical protein GCM10010909_15980 [Acidocella aquatica]
MTDDALRSFFDESRSLLESHGFKLAIPEGIDIAFWWEKRLADGSTVSITYGDQEPFGAPSFPDWSLSHGFLDGGDFAITVGLTLPEALAQAVVFECGVTSVVGGSHGHIH